MIRWCAIDEDGALHSDEGPSSGLNKLLPGAQCAGFQFEGFPLMVVVNPAPVNWRVDCVLGEGEVQRFWGLKSRDEAARTWILAAEGVLAISKTVEEAEHAKSLLFG